MTQQLIMYRHITTLAKANHDPAVHPMYFSGIEQVDDAFEMPKPRLKPAITLESPGLLGMTRLNKVLRWASIIPLQVPMCLKRALDADKRSIVLLCIRTCLRSIVTPKEYARCRDMYLARLDIEADRRFAAIIAPRQVGKTTTVVVAVLAMMLGCGDLSFGIFATKLAQSSLFFEKARAMFKHLGQRVSVNVTDASITYTPDGVTHAVIACYSGNAEVYFHTAVGVYTRTPANINVRSISIYIPVHHETHAPQQPAQLHHLRLDPVPPCPGRHGNLQHPRSGDRQAIPDQSNRVYRLQCNRARRCRSFCHIWSTTAHHWL